MGVFDRIIRGMREFSFGLSIIVFVIGLFLFLMGLFYLVAQQYELELFKKIGEWNWYVLVLGLIIFGIGVYYLYYYVKRSRLVKKELETNKRSEFLKKRTEVETTARHLPAKYKKLVEEKEEQLGIK